MNINLVQICGRITQPIRLWGTVNSSIADFSVATNRVWKNKDGEKQEEAEFHNCVAFGKTAETIAQYFGKGDEIYIQGRLKTSKWEKDGKTNYKTEIIAEQFQFGQKAKKKVEKVEKENGNDNNNYNYAGSQEQADEINEEELPF